MPYYSQYRANRCQYKKPIVNYRDCVSLPCDLVSTRTSIAHRRAKSENYASFINTSRSYSANWSSSEESSISHGSKRNSSSLSLNEANCMYGDNTEPSKVRALTSSLMRFLADLPFRCGNLKMFLLVVLTFILLLFEAWHLQSYNVSQNGFYWLENERSQSMETTQKVNEHLLQDEVKELENAVLLLTSEVRKKKEDIIHSEEVLSLLQALQNGSKLTEPELESMIQKHKEILLKQPVQLKEELAIIKEKIEKLQKFKKEFENQSELFLSNSQTSLEQIVMAIENHALKLYNGDRTGLADYALESAGASVLTTHSSETYEKQVIPVTVFGIPLRYQLQSPNIILQPDVQPGNCWAFRGDKGFVTIQLVSRIKPTAFTLEHILKSLSQTGSISSAPRDFSIFGIEDPTDMSGTLLGKYTYDKNGTSIQTFLVQVNPERSFRIIRMNVDSNWGHPEFTCIYRLRVHGELVE